MICVTIGRGRHASLVEEWKAAAKAGVELVELRIDCLRREPDLKRILKERPTPMVFTIRRGADGGLWRGNEEKRQQLLREAIALGVDYVDLEMRHRRQDPPVRQDQADRQLSQPQDHAGRPGRDRREVREAGPRHRQGAPRRPRPRRRLRVLEARRAIQEVIPTIAIAMGEIGVFTRVLGAKFGAPFTYAGLQPRADLRRGDAQLRAASRTTTATTRSTPRPRSTA